MALVFIRRKPRPGEEVTSGPHADQRHHRSCPFPIPARPRTKENETEEFTVHLRGGI